MRFIRFINELAFANSSDFDYPGKVGEVIVTNPDDKYEVRGKTHGLISHAIKHVMEFEPEYYREVIDQFKQRIASMKNDLFILNKNSTIASDAQYDLTDKMIQKVNAMK